MVGLEYVEEKISKRAITISEKDTLQQAIDHMTEHETNILIVTQNNLPRYILEEYQTYMEPPDTTIETIMNDGRLQPVEVVQSGTLWWNAVPLLREHTILVVTDTTTKVAQILELITSDSVMGKRRSTRQYKQ
jgi:predicted regulator of amino acid metabolism with ACT domain